MEAVPGAGNLVKDIQCNLLPLEKLAHVAPSSVPMESFPYSIRADPASNDSAKEWSPVRTEDVVLRGSDRSAQGGFCRLGQNHPGAAVPQDCLKPALEARVEPRQR